MPAVFPPRIVKVGQYVLCQSSHNTPHSNPYQYSRSLVSYSLPNINMQVDGWFYPTSYTEDKHLCYLQTIKWSLALSFFKDHTCLTEENCWYTIQYLQ